MPMGLLIPLIGFVVAVTCVSLWGDRGIAASLLLGVTAGMAFAFFEAYWITDPRPPVTHLQYLGYAVVAGVIWSAAWWLGSFVGYPVGFALRKRIRTVQNSN